jgi:hypothetical protein
MRVAARYTLAATLYFVVISLMGCSDGTDHKISEVPMPAPPEYLPIASVDVSLPPDVGAPLNFGLFDMATVGYEEQEYFISGTASAFTNLNELASDGFWDVEAAEQAGYTTRVLVRRPTDSAKFNGTVLVEWQNVSSGFDTSPEWDNGHVEIVRQGYAWVGVTVQFVGVYGYEGALVPFNLKAFGPIRYAAVEHPGDSFSYDIFSQVARAIREPEGIDMLNGLAVQRLIGSGNSQSAFRLTTYVNAIHPLYNPYDGYLVHSRASYSAPLAQDPQIAIPTPAEVFFRTDLNVPVLVFQTETDILRASLNSVRVRQEDSEILRYWEVAGTAHTDRYSSGGGWTDTGNDPSAGAVEEVDNIQGFIQCESAINSGPMHYVFNAALDAMNTWIVDGTAPPVAEPLMVSADLSELVLDESGNALGGIRTPYVDAPVAVLSGFGQSEESFCGLFGTTMLFSADQLASLYIDEAGYVDAVSKAAESAIEAGFILPLDAQLMIEWAPQQWRSQVIE